MIYWNEQENPNLDFDKWDYSGIGANTEEAFQKKIKILFKNDKINKKYDIFFIKYFNEFKKCLDLYEIPYSVDYLWNNLLDLNNNFHAISINIYYPEIIITNNKEQEKLFNLYFSITFDSNGYIDFEGTRETYTERHFKYNYTHSHLPGRTSTNINFSTFCLGSGVLASLKSIINSSKHNVNFLRFDCVKSVIMNIKPYLEWESEAGGPYIKMSTIGIKKINLNSVYDINHNSTELFKNYAYTDKYICKNIDYSKLKFKLENSNGLRLFKLVINKDFLLQFEETIDKYEKEHTNNLSQTRINYKFINDTLYSIDNRKSLVKDYINKPIFIRNHEIIYRNIIKDANDVEFTKNKIYLLYHESKMKNIIYMIEYIYNYNAQLKIKNYNNGTISTTVGQQQIQQIN